MSRRLMDFCILLLLSLTILLLPASLAAQLHDRISQPLQSSANQPVRGSVHPFARTELDQGVAAGSMMLNRMVMTFSPSAAQQADLAAILSEQQNPLSPYYHQWFSPEQFADRFALSASDIAKVTDWLQGQGFSVDETARSRSYVAFSGTAAQVEAAFGTPIHHYLVNGELHYANVSDPKLPWPLASLVTGIRGMNDFRPKPRAVRPRFTSNIPPFRNFVAPDDFATIYNLHALYNSGIDGTGQKIAVTGQTDLILSDIATFRTVSGLPPNVPTVVLVPGSADPGVVKGDIVEANLDVQWAGAVAPKATIVYVNSTNVFNSMFYAISQNLAPVISISYGDCEPNFSTSEINSLVAMGQQANAQGQTIVGPSGDSGAADCDFPNPPPQLTSATHGLAVDVPAALPYVTGVGGTTFNEGSGTFWSSTNNASNGSALSYIPETAWNDTAFEIAHGGSLAATGGGVSTLFTKPVWQVGTGVPNDGKRDVPDISFAASFDHDGYLICSQGSCVNGFRDAGGFLVVVGGTSAGVPTFAGVVALINQKLGAAQGNVNPRLYQLAATSTDAFHDITTGDNKVPCTAGTTNCPTGTTSIGYSAGVGYDPVTGLGSVNAVNLVNEWSSAVTPDFQAAVSPTSLTLTAGTTANVGLSTLTISSLSGFTGTVALTCTVASLTGTTCSVSPPSLTNSGAATVTVTAPSSATSTQSGTVTVSATSGSLSHSATIAVTVNPSVVVVPDFQVSASPTSLSLTAGTTGNVGSSTLTVTALNSFTGTVAFTCSVPASLPGSRCAVSPPSLTNSGTATVTVTAPTTRASLRPPRLFPRFFPWADGSFAIAMGLMFAGKRERMSRKTRIAILAVMLIIAIAIMIGCGGGGSPATSSTSGSSFAGTGTVTVTATSGALSHAATITVTVN